METMLRLRVSPNGHYLIKSDGTPFFWLGDTAWQMFNKLDRTDVDFYLEDRVSRGFTVVQAVILTWEGNMENTYGNKPFNVDFDLASINDAYFENVDYCISKAEEKGLYIALLPMLKGPEITKWLPEAQKAFLYGHYLGRRYGLRNNIIWVLGGDVCPDISPEKPQKQYLECWRELAKGIATGANDGNNPEYSKCLMGYHPSGTNGGYSSSAWFHDDEWLDFNGIETWESADQVYAKVGADYRLTPPKPIIMLEPAYENDQNPTYVNNVRTKKYINAMYTRRQAYWSFLAGAAGYTMGNDPIFGFSSTFGGWKSALGWDGSVYAARYKEIVSSLQWWKLVPDLSILKGDSGDGDMTIAAGRSNDGRRVLVYVPVLQMPGETAVPRHFTVDMGKISQYKEFNCKWVDPRTGDEIAIGTCESIGTRAFETPDGWEDALLMLEAQA